MISEPWAIFTDPDLFGDTVTFTDSSNNNLSINGLFDEENVPMFDELNAEGKRLILAIRKEDYLDVYRGVSVLVRGINYEVVKIEPIQDGRILDLTLKLKS